MDVDPGAAAPNRYPLEVTEAVSAALSDFGFRHTAISELVPDDSAIAVFDAACGTLSLDDEDLLARASELDASAEPQTVEFEEREQCGSLCGHYEAWLQKYAAEGEEVARRQALVGLRQVVAERVFRLEYFGARKTYYPFVRKSRAFLASSILITMVTRNAWRQLHPEDNGSRPLAAAA
jgi:hypothetical protein